jgi:hypothetical protein
VLRTDDGGSQLPVSAILGLLDIGDIPTAGATAGQVLTISNNGTVTTAAWETPSNAGSNNGGSVTTAEIATTGATAGQVLTVSTSGSVTTAAWETPAAPPATTNPQDFYTYSAGVLTAGQVLFSINAVRPLAFLADAFAIVLDAAATAATTFSVSHNGASIGSLVVSAGGTVAACTTPVLALATGDNLRVLSPTPADATAGGAAFSTTCTR